MEDKYFKDSINKKEKHKQWVSKLWGFTTIIIIAVLLFNWYKDYTTSRKEIQKLRTKVVDLDRKRAEEVAETEKWKSKYDNLQSENFIASTPKISSDLALPSTESESTDETTTEDEKEAVAKTDSSFTEIKAAGYISLGSSKEEVKTIMGTPNRIFMDQWGYGLSKIEFDENNQVVGWSEIDKKLLVKLVPTGKKLTAVRLGSSKQDVIDVMGTPSSIFMDQWGYGLSHIEFDENNQVVGWSEIDRKLKVH
jgi:hypothetical protein